MFTEDEGIRADTTVESLGKLRPAFTKDGTITAGSASQISDGACAVVVMSKAKAEELGLTWLAEIGAHGNVAGPDTSLQSSRPTRSRKACEKEGLAPSDLDLIEINEAFAAVGIVSARELGLSDDKVNVNGGAIALGHPIGMSGARIVLHLALELKRRGGGTGAAALCGGGGQGDALIVRVPRLSEENPSTAPTGQAPVSRGGRRRSAASVPDLVEQARAGDARAVARLISLVEDASPLLREVMAALAPYTGQRPRRRPDRLARRRQVHHDLGPGHGAAGAGKRVGVLAVDPSSPFSGGALLGDRVRMQEHATDPGVYIRSMATRGHLGGLVLVRPRRRCACWTPPAATWCSSRPSASARAEVEIAALADTTLVLLAPGMGDGIQAAKAGILEIGDVYVVNKADRDGAERHVRDLRNMIGARRSGREDAWRPPIVQTVARRARASTRWSRRSTPPRVDGVARRELERRRMRRARDEIEAIAVTALRARWGDVHARTELDDLAEQVAAGKSDPYRAADSLLDSFTELDSATP